MWRLTPKKTARSGPSGLTPGMFQSTRQLDSTTAVGVVLQSSLEDVALRYMQSLSWAVGVHNEIPYFGVEHVLEREGDLIEELCRGAWLFGHTASRSGKDRARWTVDLPLRQWISIPCSKDTSVEGGIDRKPTSYEVAR